MEITSVEPQRKNPHRFNIFLDGKFAFGADENLVVEQRLIVGKQLDNSELESLIFEAEVGKLMERVYGLLSRRMRSEKEIRDYFRNLSFKRKVKGKEEISSLVIDATIEKLKQKNLINDKEFAKAWIEARGEKKSSRAIQSELFKKGIGREIIEEVMSDEEGLSSQNQEKIAKQLLEKRMDRWKNLSPLEKKKKMYEFLLRRGFGYDVVKYVIEKLLKKQ